MIFGNAHLREHRQNFPRRVGHIRALGRKLARDAVRMHDVQKSQKFTAISAFQGFGVPARVLAVALLGGQHKNYPVFRVAAVRDRADRMPQNLQSFLVGGQDYEMVNFPPIIWAIPKIYTVEPDQLALQVEPLAPAWRRDDFLPQPFFVLLRIAKQIEARAPVIGRMKLQFAKPTQKVHGRVDGFEHPVQIKEQDINGDPHRQQPGKNHAACEREPGQCSGQNFKKSVKPGFFHKFNPNKSEAAIKRRTWMNAAEMARKYFQISPFSKTKRDRKKFTAMTTSPAAGSS